jgi:hypothetical protein
MPVIDSVLSGQRKSVILHYPMEAPLDGREINQPWRTSPAQVRTPQS